MAEIFSNAHTDDLEGRFLTFYINGALYGIELSHVIEIIQVQSFTHIPNVPPYVKGVINLRGKIVPAIDVRLKFNLPEIEYNDKTCIIVVTINDMQVGLIVDSVSEVATINPDRVSVPPEFGSRDTNKYLAGIAEVGKRVILIIDCGRFFYSDLNATGIY